MGGQVLHVSPVTPSLPSQLFPEDDVKITKVEGPPGSFCNPILVEDDNTNDDHPIVITSSDDEQW